MSAPTIDQILNIDASYATAIERLVQHRMVQPHNGRPAAERHAWRIRCAQLTRAAAVALVAEEAAAPNG